MVMWHHSALRAVRDGVRAALRIPGWADRAGPASRAEHRITPRGYMGPATGPVRVTYSPTADGNADPGEVVWTWVPYEEDDGRGKDRPVLVIGRDGTRLVGLMLTSKDHDRDAADERRHGRIWLDIGTGDWDSRHRPSEVRLDRVMLFDPAAVRREGARLDREVFNLVAARLQQVHGWAG